VELLSEVHGETAGSQGYALALSLGTRLRLRPFGTLLISRGRDLHNTLDERARIFGYAGWQLNITGPDALGPD
jgi:hypothetical protein